MPSRTRSQAWLDLLSSMRFAISLLTVLAIAAIIGTVLKQNEPYTNYLNQFGPFWFKIFEWLGFYSVYSSWWFSLILAFLIASTSLCIYRNGPQMIREMRSFRERAKETSLSQFTHRAEYQTRLPMDQLRQHLADYLKQQKFQFKVNSEAENGSVLFAAKTGSLYRLGYLVAHSAVVLICLGGLLNGDLLLKMRLFIGNKEIQNSNLITSRIPPQGRLGPDNFSFRANMLVAEGTSQDEAILNVKEGILIQELPFIISLKEFRIEHYSTGPPKLFASKAIITDKESRQSFEATIKVNAPLIYKNIAIYQSSFDDGGSSLKLRVNNLAGSSTESFSLDGKVGEAVPLKRADYDYTLELTGFRSFNVENISQSIADSSPSFMEKLKRHFGSATKSIEKKDFRNVGPSFTYKLRDQTGQAREYQNYMLPLQFEGRWFMLSGMRETPNDAFRYLRLPLDDNGSLESYHQLRAVLLDPSLPEAIAKRLISGKEDKRVSNEFRAQLTETVARSLRLFMSGGFQAVAQFLESSVPLAEREKAADAYVKILQSAAWEAYQLARSRANLPTLPPTPAHAQFIQDSLNSISDSFFYGVPIYLQLTDYDEVKASVFQLTRSPGQTVLYLGFALLILGVFIMLYIHERRLWLLLKSEGRILLAITTNRKTLDFEREFLRHQEDLSKLLNKHALN